ncbi:MULTISPECIES: hypothetical protein [unclassified Rhodococcus (in: high G+C Gram-positive bacteria)]|uniref:hypothetical protein n=1 Tax=unclassified Rhodococcus (in: high G+C Gram-positive bacteria) TaxID=192944 RepID=UPI000B9B2CE3|nr:MULTISPECIES: hypothetical protein [unclassified Rhodococcus (in: high G+C Gram-positive bacteria)]OZE34269.1 hypothetical protein CH259_19885 [Rhodococcus sp. 05-2254-4]OZE51467.1 hypothetical protein CH261_02570 [Rhodococcus sp. 05-2254-3]OZE53117.1 hypothetical protein CH283_07660 [Rhodococcus sp. 05-2254-2]
MTEQPGSASVGTPDVGLHLDDERAVAAVSHPIAPGPSLHLASLHSTVLNTHPDGTVSLGDATDDDSEAYTHFLDSLADGVGVTGSKGTVFPAEQLTSMALLCLLTEVASSIGLRPGDLAAAATYPAQWTAEQVFALRSAMNAHGLAHVALVAEEEALAAWNASLLPTLQKKDTAIASARGAAILAAQFPVDAVTEQFAVVSPARSDRRPLFAAAAFAAALTVGAALFALQLGTPTDTDVPTIDNAQLVPSTSSSGTGSGGPIDFPTVVAEPAAEIVPVAPSTATTTTEETTPTETSDLPRSEPTETEPGIEIETRPAFEAPEDDDREKPPIVVEPVRPELPDEPTDETPDTPETPDTDPDDGQSVTEQIAPNDRSAETP